MSAAFEVSDLRQRPDFLGAVVDRIWTAWWQDRVSRADFAERVRGNLTGEGLPIAFVAHDGDAFLGTASLIASDLDERPQLTPWVAAVWTDPAARGRGVAGTLIGRCCQTSFAMGHAQVHLCARPPLRAFYLASGWTPIEDGVGPHAMTVFRKTRAE